MAALVAAMDHSDNKKPAPHGSPTKPVQQLPPLSPKMIQAAHQQQLQYYGAPTGQHLPSPDYRGSPPGAASMSLPSIQHFEGAGMQSQPQYLPPAHMNGVPPMMHAPQYNPNMVQYQPQPMPPTMPPTMPSNAPNGHNGHNGMMRYPIPPQAPMDSRNMSGGKHRKEIKRRTKSGCLTCRKRRIKCDEGHPSCRNCQKSKRDCMGYDPVFKTDRVPSIQPAPVSSAPLSKASPIMSTLPSNSYPPYQGAGGSFIHQLPHTAAPLDGSISYHGSVDSVLADQEVKGPNATNDHSYMPGIQTARRVVKLTIDELFDLNDIPPQLPIRSVPDISSPEVSKELESLYNFQYAHALDKLFETSWYSTHGFATLMADHKLCEFAVQCVDEMRAKTGAYGHIAPTPALASLEARLVWSLAVMPRSHHLYNASNLTSESLVLELLPRLDTVENLLTGRYLDASRMPPPASAILDGSNEQNLKSSQQGFWYHLGKFTSLRDDHGDSQMVDQVLRELANMRMILNVLENRDVLYSIAVARHIGGRMPDWSPQTPHLPLTHDPNDDVSKLHIAHDFVQTEDERGTSQVIQRICSMSLRSWNLQRRAQQQQQQQQQQ